MAAWERPGSDSDSDSESDSSPSYGHRLTDAEKETLFYGTENKDSYTTHYIHDTVEVLYFDWKKGSRVIKGNIYQNNLRNRYTFVFNESTKQVRLYDPDNVQVCLTKPIPANLAYIGQDDWDEFQDNWGKKLPKGLFGFPDWLRNNNELKSMYKRFCLEIFHSIVYRQPDQSGSGGSRPKTSLKSTGTSVTFTKDGKKVKRVVHVNARGTKVVKYNGSLIPVSKLRVG
jgi:hypothetical protein